MVNPRTVKTMKIKEVPSDIMFKLWDPQAGYNRADGKRGFSAYTTF